MAKQLVQINNTSRTEYVFIQNSSVSTGAGLSTLVFNTAGLTADYCVERGARVNIPLVTQSATGAYSSGGFCAVDTVNLPGLYRFDIPNNVFNVAGSDKAVVMLKGATNMAPVLLEYQIVAFNPDDAVRLGLTALPSVAIGTIGSIALGNATGAVTVADKTGYSLSGTQAFNVTGNITGNLSGSVGSVTGSVGSVTGSVTGSVGSIATGGITTASFAAGAINAAAIATDAIGSDELAATATAEIADAILARNLDSSGNEVSTTTSGRTVRNALRILRNKVDASGGTQVDVYNEADTTVIWSQPITTSVSADPIVKVGT
jgi:hypothetical protein